MKICFKSLAFITLCAIGLSCSSVFAIEKLRLIADQNIVTGEKFKETEIGGLSGIVLDRQNNKLLAISDDRSMVNDARFYEFDFKIDEKAFSITPKEVVILKNKDGKSFKKDDLDCEGISLLANGDVVISSEGNIGHNPIINPELLIFSRDGKWKSNIEIPEKFLPQKNQEAKIGARDNLVFEGLSSTPDNASLFVGTEEALFQDDRTSTPTHASTIRIIQYKNLKPYKEFAYTLEKIPSISVAGLTVGETGLSDLLAINDTTFYSIERSYLPLAKRTIIRLFKNTINEKTTDISGIPALKGASFKTVDKELLANLDDFTSLMTKDFQHLDNIEGITYGPKLGNGHETLILISDNNFNKKQRTQILAFEIIP